MLNLGIVTNVIGVLLVILGLFMFTALPFSLYFGTNDVEPIAYAGLVTIVIGLSMWFFSRKTNKRISKREGYLIVALGWFVIAVFSALPYVFTGALPHFADAMFESTSGLTTTGASVITDIEILPQGILFWRSLTQWLGGMGIIVLTVAIFPLLGIGGVELFVAEAPGPTSDKIHPRIRETAKRLWLIYLGLTIILTILLYASGMTGYDAVNHAFTTMATGGFSTKNASVAYYDNIPIIQYILALFMFFAGVNYTVIYFSLKGQFKKVWRSDEFKTYTGLVIVLIIFTTAGVVYSTEHSFEKAFRDAMFQVLSVLTTTGFVSADYTAWSPVLTLTFFMLLFVGGCAGSTTGGIKIIRHLVFFKNSILELKRLLHPKAIIRTKIDGKLVAPRILTHILVFLLLYLMIFFIGSFIMTIVLNDFNEPLLSAAGAVATSLGNVGPSIGELGPLDNFAKVPMFGKWVLVFLMLFGRLEIFTVLLIFTPYFWRDN